MHVCKTKQTAAPESRVATCDGSTPKANYASFADGCVPRSVFGPAIVTATGSTTGLCCVGQTLDSTFQCDDSACGSCNCGSSLFPATCNRGFQNCKTSSYCDGTVHQGDPAYCCNYDSRSSEGDIPCPCGVKCGQVLSTCAGTGTEPTQTFINYPGGESALQPLVSPLPRLRGLMMPIPTGFGATSVGCSGSVNFFTSARFNGCVFGMPRPPVAGVLVTTTAVPVTTGLLYTATFYEPSPLSLVTSFGSPVTWGSSGGDANERARVYPYVLPGGMSVWGGLYSGGVPLSTMQTCASTLNGTTDVCATTTRPYGLALAVSNTGAAVDAVRSRGPSLGGTLVRYYSALIRGGGRPSEVFDAVWARVGASMAADGAHGPPAGLYVSPPVSSLQLAPGVVTAALRATLGQSGTGGLFGCEWTRDDAPDNDADGGGAGGGVNIYCMHGCHAYRPSSEVATYLWGRWCGANSTALWAAIHDGSNGDGGVAAWPGKVRPLVEQVVSSDVAVMGFSTTPTATSSVTFRTMVSPPVDAAFYASPALLSYVGSATCWQSARGTVGDYVETLGGVCYTSTARPLCYVLMNVSTVTGERLFSSGCWNTALHDATGFSAVSTTATTTGGGGVLVDWDTATGGALDPSSLMVAGSTACGIRSNGVVSHLCLMVPTALSDVVRIPPNYFMSETHLGPTTALQFSDPIVQAPHLHDVLQLMCGCGGGVEGSGVIESPTQLCRSNGGSGRAVGVCYVSNASTCDGTDFNCGTYYGFSSTGDGGDPVARSGPMMRLCRGCRRGSNNVLTVGQCMTTTTTTTMANGTAGGGVCSGMDEDGTTCLDPNATVCRNVFASGTPPGAVDTGNVGTSLRASMAALGTLGVGATEGGTVLWDVLNAPGKWLPGVVGGTDGWSTAAEAVASLAVDAVNCVPVAPQMGNRQHVAVLESPRYFSAEPSYPVPATPTKFPAGLTEEALSAWCAASSTCMDLGDIRYTMCMDIGLSRCVLLCFNASLVCVCVLMLALTRAHCMVRVVLMLALTRGV